jgi:hypothetical protein
MGPKPIKLSEEMVSIMYGDDELYDYIDIDCTDCGMKFIVRPYTKEEKECGKTYPTKCGRCQRGLPPLYEY